MKTELFIVVALVAVVVALFAWAVAKSKNATPVHRPVVGNANRKFFRRHMRKVYLAPLLIQKVFGFLPSQVAPRATLQFANIGEGTAPTGRKTYIPDATTTARYLLYKTGSDADHVALAGLGDTPLGPSDDQVDDITIPITINLLGAVPGTVRVVSNGTVTNGAFLKCAANGQVTNAVTTDVVIGRAVIGTDSTSAAGDVISIVPIVPGKYPF